jgi:hypothetical protein
VRRYVNSIGGRLVLGLFAFSSLLLLTVGLLIHHEIKSMLMSSVEHTLHSKTQMIVGLLHEEHDVIEMELSEVVLGEYSIPRSGHYYRVKVKGETVAASNSLVEPEFDLTQGAVIKRDDAVREILYLSTGPGGEPIMTLRHDLEFNGLPVTVHTSESIRESLAAIAAFKHFLFAVIPVSILAGGIIGLFVAKRSLAPLKTFIDSVGRITHKNMDERLDIIKQPDELSELAASFNDMLQRLQRAFEAEKRLVSDASHQLQTPIAVVKTHCDVMLQRQRSAQEYADTLKTIRTAAENVSALIKDLLSLATLDSGALTGVFKPLSLTTCICDAVKLTSHNAEIKRIAVNIDTPTDITILGHSVSLIEALYNVLDNAVKYNNDGGSVIISTRIEKNKAVITVEDTGVGLLDEDIPYIFDRFYRSNKTRAAEGTGLGLSITKAVIEAHGGSVSACVSPGRGAKIIMMMPVIL